MQFACHRSIPVILRVLTVILSLATIITSTRGKLRSCTFGEEIYSSNKQINYMIACASCVLIGVSFRVLFHDVKKHRNPHVLVLILFDTVFLILTFIAAVVASLSPVANEICTNDDLKRLMQEICEFKCSNVLSAITTTFMTFICFLFSILFTTNVIPVAQAEQPQEDFTFGEESPAPKGPQTYSQPIAYGNL